MILKPAPLGIGDADGSTDGSNWDKATGVLNSNAVGQVLGWLTGNKSSGSSSSASHPTATTTSPWLYVGGGLLGIGALTLLLRRRRR